MIVAGLGQFCDSTFAPPSTRRAISGRRRSPGPTRHCYWKRPPARVWVNRVDGSARAHLRVRRPPRRLHVRRHHGWSEVQVRVAHVLRSQHHRNTNSRRRIDRGQRVRGCLRLPFQVAGGRDGVQLRGCAGDSGRQRCRAHDGALGW